MVGFGTSPLELMACEAMLAGIAYLDEFTYSVSFNATNNTQLTNARTMPIQLLINNDSDFIYQEQNLVAFLDGEIVDDPNFLLLIQRGGSGRDLMNQPQHVLSATGSHQSLGRTAGRKPMPGLWVANSTITVTLQNLTTDDYDRVDVAFLGFKVFYQINPITNEEGNRVKIFHVM